MSFDSKQFAVNLISEVLFYDEEYGAIGNFSLIDTEQSKERYIAFYSPEEGSFFIEEAVSWEPSDPDDTQTLGYEFAMETKSFMVAQDPHTLAARLVELAEEKSLQPSVSLAYEEEEI